MRYLVTYLEPGESVLVPCVVEPDDGEGRVMVGRNHTLIVNQRMLVELTFVERFLLSLKTVMGSSGI